MRQVVFLVHGMGNNATGVLGKADMSVWAKDAEKMLRAALTSFPAVDPEDLFIVPVLYDDVFRSHVARWNDLAEALVGTALESLTKWMKDTDKQDFLWGNVGDVVLYRGFAEVREHVLTHVARQFLEQAQKFGIADTQYSVVAHSLGTAVAHDALQKLYSVGVDGKKLPFKFQNFFAIANVSRLMWVTNDAFYEETCVRPPDCGLAQDKCAVMHYATFRHIADPFASIVRFTRKNWSPQRFWSLDLDFFRELNVHSLTSYLADPRITNSLYYRLFGAAAVTPSAMQERLDKFVPYTHDVLGTAKRDAVRAMAALLDGLSASSHGAFVDDFDDVGKAAIEAQRRGLLI